MSFFKRNGLSLVLALVNLIFFGYWCHKQNWALASMSGLAVIVQLYSQMVIIEIWRNGHKELSSTIDNFKRVMKR
jgi:hypothetical protein